MNAYIVESELMILWRFFTNLILFVGTMGIFLAPIIRRYWKEIRK
jgi:hypothetical protein